jgi:hypothetical protein
VSLLKQVMLKELQKAFISQFLVQPSTLMIQSFVILRHYWILSVWTSLRDGLSNSCYTGPRGVSGCLRSLSNTCRLFKRQGTLRRKFHNSVNFIRTAELWFSWDRSLNGHVAWDLKPIQRRPLTLVMYVTPAACVQLCNLLCPTPNN